jgi:hypothetical protein
MKELSKVYMSESDDFVNWFYSLYEKTEQAHSYIKMKDVYNAYRSSDLFDNLSKKDKRKNNYDKMNKDVKENPTLRVHFCPRKEIQGKNLTNILMGHRVKIEEVDEED